MPTLPVVTNYQAVSNQRRPVSEGQRSATAEIDAWGQVARSGQALEEFNRRIRDANITSDVAQAEMRLKAQEAAIVQSLETDGEADPDTFVERYTSAMNAVMAEHEGKLSSPLAKRLWEDRTIGFVDGGVQKVHQLGMRRKVDKAKARLIETGSILEINAQDLATPQSVLDEGYASYSEAIEVYQKRNFISEAEAISYKLTAEETVRSGKAMRQRANLDEMIDTGRYAEARAYLNDDAKDLTYDEKEKLRDVLDGKDRIGEAVNQADMIWKASGENYESAILATEEIDDAEKRLAIEGRLDVLRVQSERVRAQEERTINDALDIARQAMLDGRHPSQIPASEWVKIPGTERLALEGEWNSLQRMQMKETGMSSEDRRLLREYSEADANYIRGFGAENPEVFAMGPSAWKKEAPELYAVFNGLTVTDRSKIQLEATEKRISMEDQRDEALSGSRVDKVYNGVLNSMGVYLNQMGVKTDNYGDLIAGKGESDLSNNEKRVRGYLYEEIRKWTSSNPDREPTSEEMRKMVANSMTRLKPKLGKEVKVIDLRREDPDGYEFVRKQLTETYPANEPPTEAEIERAYRRLVMESFDNGR
jgi:hypothetical protein